MRVRATVSFPYDARTLRAGEELDMPDDYARVLGLMGKVEAVSEPEPPKRRYRRRDMRAEG